MQGDEYVLKKCDILESIIFLQLLVSKVLLFITFNTYFKIKLRDSSLKKRMNISGDKQRDP